MKTTSFQQTIELGISPDDFYRFFLNSSQHSMFTGSEAEMSDQVGEAFSVFDGYAHGKNLELLPGKKIRQTWTADELAWADFGPSIITLDLEETEEGGTRIRFSHEKVPPAIEKQLKDGWEEYYWSPLRELFPH